MLREEICRLEAELAPFEAEKCRRFLESSEFRAAEAYLEALKCDSMQL